MHVAQRRTTGKHQRVHSRCDHGGHHEESETWHHCVVQYGEVPTPYPHTRRYQKLRSLQWLELGQPGSAASGVTALGVACYLPGGPPFS